jgi:plastocyanin
MRKALLLLVGVLAVAIVGATSPAGAQRSAVANVSITATGFNPDDVTVKPGDTVTWKNNDTANHQVVADRGEFKSPVLKPGNTYSFRFELEASYAYHDAMKPSSVGTVSAVDIHPTAAVSRRHVVYGNVIRVFGVVPNDRSGEEVTVHIMPYRGQETTKTVFTKDGAYEFTYRPTIRTQFFATWEGATSRRTPAILVRPKVIFRTLNAQQNRFSVRVRPAAKYGRIVVKIQRLNNKGLWVTTTRVRLNTSGFKRFTGHFPRGVTKAQAWVRAKPGYAIGFSTTKTIVR